MTPQLKKMAMQGVGSILIIIGIVAPMYYSPNYPIMYYSFTGVFMGFLAGLWVATINENWDKTTKTNNEE